MADTLRPAFFRPDRREEPLTLGKLVEMIDRAQEGGGVAMSALIYNVESGADLPAAQGETKRVRTFLDPFGLRLGGWTAFTLRGNSARSACFYPHIYPQLLRRAAGVDTE